MKRGNLYAEQGQTARFSDRLSDPTTCLPGLRPGQTGKHLLTGPAKAGPEDRWWGEVKRGNLSPSAIEGAQQQLLLWSAASVTARASLLRVWSEFVSVTGADPMLKNLPLRHAR